MTLLDRYILKQFLFNFLILFLILFLFSSIVDLFVNINGVIESVDANTASAQATGSLNHILYVISFIGRFYFPRLFQFYAFLVGLLTIGATGFTLVQLHRHRELTAVLAAGVSLHRVALPIIAAAIILNVFQFINREIFLPHYAPVLIRSQSEFGLNTIRAFRVPLLRDSEGNMFYAAKYFPNEHKMERVVILKFNNDLILTSRINADSAVWQPQPDLKQQGILGKWIFENGRHAAIRTTTTSTATTNLKPQPVSEIQTDLDPTRLMLYRHREYRQMLSLKQINELEESAGTNQSEHEELQRVRYGRFAQILINLLTLLITLPFFLLRSPANLLTQSVKCAALGITAQIGGAIGTAVGFPGIPPVASVFLFPLLILLPLAVALMSRVET